ncbi:hypothetical protein BGX34_002773 [Mortierella sp. NVP85]|nr:hypothetical protein BGX34_002773 [Mortierella sp. NVP85]
MTILTNTKLDLDVESIVYPQYDTRGDFSAAVKTFAEWTLQQVKSREEFNLRVFNTGEHGPDKDNRIPPVYVCFIGHSMGGLVAADAALLLDAQPTKSPVIGILAFDTPYFGLNHKVFTEAAYERAVGAAQKAADAYPYLYVPATLAYSAISSATSSSTVPVTSSKQASEEQQRLKGQQQPSGGLPNGFNPSSLFSTTSSAISSKEKTVATSSKTTTSGSKWSWGSIALGVGAAVVAAGAAYALNAHVSKGMEYINSHIQFVGILWDNSKLKQRVESVLKLPIGFHCFYTQVQIPASVSNNWASASRTFVELASIPKETQNFFSPRNCSGQDEIEAHMEMFNPDKNFDYYQMGEETVKRVNGMIENALKREL